MGREMIEEARKAFTILNETYQKLSNHRSKEKIMRAWKEKEADSIIDKLPPELENATPAEKLKWSQKHRKRKRQLRTEHVKEHGFRMQAQMAKRRELILRRRK